MRVLPILFLLTFFLIPALVHSEATYQTAKIYTNPFYRPSMTNGVNYTSIIEVKPPDGIGKVISAVISADIYITPTVAFNITVNGQACNTNGYLISTTFASAGQSRLTFDCSNVITKAGKYSIMLRASQANTGASTLWLDLTYESKTLPSIKISGTEYTSGTVGKIFAQLLVNGTAAFDNSTCRADVYYPNGTKWLNQQTLAPVGENGLYSYSFLTPDVEGVYILAASCVLPQLNTNLSTTVTQTDNFEDTAYCSGGGFADGWRPVGTLVYKALRDEPNTDGIADNFISFAGTFTTSIQNLTSWLIKARPSANITSLDVTINSMGGTPYNQNLQYEISICGTNKTGLGANQSFGADCTTPSIIVNPSANLSCFINNALSAQQRYIPFTNSYTMNSSLNTIVTLRALNAVNGSSQFWTVKVDGATPAAQFRRVLNAAATNYSYIPQINLYEQDIAIVNNSNCLSGNCIRIGSGSIERPLSTLQATSINITFWSRTQGLNPQDQANLYFWDNTYKPLFTWESDDSDPLWTRHSITLSSNDYIFSGATRIEFEIEEQNNSQNYLFIDNITITQTFTNYTFQNDTTYDVIRSTNEIHIDNILKNLGLEINSTATNIQSQQIITNTNILTINDTVTSIKNDTTTIAATTGNIWAYLQGFITTILNSILGETQSINNTLTGIANQSIPVNVTNADEVFIKQIG